MFPSERSGLSWNIPHRHVKDFQDIHNARSFHEKSLTSPTQRIIIFSCFRKTIGNWDSYLPSCYRSRENEKGNDLGARRAVVDQPERER